MFTYKSRIFMYFFIFEVVISFKIVLNAVHVSLSYSRLTGFDALLIDRMVYYKFRVIL